MAMDMAAMVNLGLFKVHKKAPERILADFNLYLESFSNFLVVTDNTDATDAKKAML